MSKITICMNVYRIDDETDQKGFAMYRFDVPHQGKFGVKKRLQNIDQPAILRDKKLIQLNLMIDEEGNEYIL